MSASPSSSQGAGDFARSTLTSPLALAVTGVALAAAAGYYFVAPWIKNMMHDAGSTTGNGNTQIVQGFEKERALLDHVLKTAKKGDAQSVVDTIDAYCWAGGHMMHIGDVKGAVVDEKIKAKNPKVAVELGGYCGYSAVRFARWLPDDSIYISIEMSSGHAAIARQIVEHAGLSHKVKFVVDETEIVLNNFKNRTGYEKIDFLFIDHEKKLYLRDIKTIINKDLLASGAVVAADNVITPGAPDYLAFIRANLSFKSELHRTKAAYNNDKEDGVEISVYY